MRGAADALPAAFAAGDARRGDRSGRRAGNALAALGQAAGLPIVTPPFARAAALARELGGAAKPSGAGGGDVGVAFFTDQEAAATFAPARPHIGVEILSVRTCRASASGAGRQ